MNKNVYLVILIGDRHLGEKAAENLLSCGGRLVLVNNSLSSLTIYTKGFYRFNEIIHKKKLDSIISRFFWRGVSDKFKYHIVNWGLFADPKIMGV